MADCEYACLYAFLVRLSSREVPWRDVAAEMEAGLNRNDDALVVVTRFLNVRRGKDSSEGMTDWLGNSTSISFTEASRDTSREEDEEAGLSTTDPSS